MRLSDRGFYDSDWLEELERSAREELEERVDQFSSRGLWPCALIQHTWHRRVRGVSHDNAPGGLVDGSPGQSLRSV